MKPTLLAICISVPVIAGVSGCKKDTAPTGVAPAAGTPAATAEPAVAPEKGPATATSHGEARPLGQVTLGAWTFDLTLKGTLQPGKEGAIEAARVNGPEGAALPSNTYLTLEGAGGEVIGAPSKAVIEGGKLHFHAMAIEGKPAPAVAVLRLREGGTDIRERIPLAPATAAGGGATAPGHTHDAAPHGGILTPFTAGATTGFAEVKLHDDKGDVEVWLGTDKSMKTPLDLPVSATLTLKLIDKAGREITLAPRNTTRNEDEDGTPNLRDGKTNYFIFPGTTGADSTWLKGKDFQSLAVLSFTLGADEAKSDELVLIPHTHGPGGHTHPPK